MKAEEIKELLRVESEVKPSGKSCFDAPPDGIFNHDEIDEPMYYHPDAVVAFASHVLQEYKKGLAEWVKENKQFDEYYGDIVEVDKLTHYLTKLKEDE